jgi:hypothetical protein
MKNQEELTPKNNHEHAFRVAFVGPIEGRWICGILLLHDPAINPGRDVKHDNIIET